MNMIRTVFGFSFRKVVSGKAWGAAPPGPENKTITEVSASAPFRRKVRRKERSKEGRKEGRKQGRREGKKEEGRKARRKEGKKEGKKEGRKRKK